MKSKSAQLVIFSVVFLAVHASGLSTGSKPTIGAEQIRRLNRVVPELLKAAEVPGISAAVLRDRRIVWTGAFGVRNLETGDLVLEDTIFSAASLSKPVVATAVLQLAARGEWDLDQPLWEILEYPRLEHDDRAKQITTRLVLSHRTGLPNWGATPLEMIDDPGAGWGYSGEGFVYLQKALEKATGLSLNELVSREVFQPLSMTESSFVWREDYAGRTAYGHGEWGEVQGEPRREEANAAASLTTTAGDYARLLTGLMQNRLAEGTLELMSRPVTQVGRWGDPATHAHVHWGLGWGIQNAKRGLGLWHWGDNGDFRCYVLFYPEHGDGLVYFTNSNNGLSIAPALLETLFDDTHWPLQWLTYGRHDDPQRLARRELRQIFLDQGVEAGLARLRQWEEESPELLGERFINRLGYAVLEDRPEAAAAIFRINVERHPSSANVHDSLGEALLALDRLDVAGKRFQRAGELDPENKAFQRHLTWVREMVEALKNPVELSVEQLQTLTGRYGPRQVELREGRLFYQREGNPRGYLLTPMQANIFMLEGLNTFRLRFVLDEEGRPIKLVGHYFNGNTDEFELIPNDTSGGP